jgi:hypothetical protein
MRARRGTSEGPIFRPAIVLAFFVVPLLVLPGWAQFTPAEVAERPRWEAFLKEAKIVAERQLSFEEGVTQPWQLTLRQGDVVAGALWKNPSGVRGGYWEGWKYEIAAYLLDKLLGVSMVPPTVEKTFAGYAGSCQLWIEGTSLYRDRAAEGQDRAPFQTDGWRKAGYIAQLFDNLIGNEDRHMGNVLVTSDIRAILIDHSRTFRTTKSFVKSIPFSEKNVPAEELMRRLPRTLVRKTFALSEKAVRDVVGDLLTDEEIGAVMARKKLLVLEVRRIIAQFGENNVLY